MCHVVFTRQRCLSEFTGKAALCERFFIGQQSFFVKWKNGIRWGDACRNLYIKFKSIPDIQKQGEGNVGGIYIQIQLSYE